MAIVKAIRTGAGALTAVVALSSTLLVPAAATAAPAPTYAVTSIPAGIASGGELAIDQGRGALFIADNNNPFRTTGQDIILSDKPVKPKVQVFSTATNKPTRSIDLRNQPGGLMMIGKQELIPTPQVPDGLAIDPVRNRVLVTNAHASGITVFGMNDRAVTPRNLTALPTSHPMGAVADTKTGRFYVGLNGTGKVAVFSSAGKHLKDIGNLNKASFLTIDESRNRLYVGNADYEAKKDNFLAVVDLATEKVVKRIKTPSNSRPKVDPATGKIWLASFDTGKISVVDPDSLSIVQTIDTKSSPAKLAIDGQRRLVYTSNLQKKSITVIDADSGAILTTVSTGSKAPHTIVVDEKTGRVYATEHMSGNLTVLTPR